MLYFETGAMRQVSEYCHTFLIDGTPQPGKDRRVFNLVVSIVYTDTSTGTGLAR